MISKFVLHEAHHRESLISTPKLLVIFMWNKLGHLLQEKAVDIRRVA